jgi:hypothetical protein
VILDISIHGCQLLRFLRFQMSFWLANLVFAMSFSKDATKDKLGDFVN